MKKFISCILTVVLVLSNANLAFAQTDSITEKIYRLQILKKSWKMKVDKR